MDEPSSVSVKELDASKLVHIPGFTLEALQAETHLVQIWEAYQISLERKVLIVNLLQELVSSPEKAAWFEELVRFVARLRHPNFVQVIDVSPPGTEIPYVILEAAEGTDLAGRLREGPLPPEAAARVTRQIAEALDAAWKHSGFIHRNLKAGSIRLQPDGSARIFRFLAGTFCRPGVNPFAHDEDMLIGTPNYMSPEQIDGEPSIDFHTDIYGLGCLFYEMLTGKAPFSEESDPIRVLALQKTGKLPSPTVVNPSIPAGYSYILHRMTAKQAAEVSGLSVSRFLHLFRTETGYSFSDWLQRLRVARACRLLEESPYKLAEIAEIAGIRDQSRMTVLFRRYLNTTPGEYRASSRRENAAKADA